MPDRADLPPELAPDDPSPRRRRFTLRGELLLALFPVMTILIVLGFVEIFSRQRTDGFSFDVEVLLLARAMGFSVHEMPVHWSNSSESNVRVVRDSLGMLIEIVDRTRVRSMELGVVMLATVRALAPGLVQFSAATFDRLAGTDQVRHRYRQLGLQAQAEAGGGPPLSICF